MKMVHLRKMSPYRCLLCASSFPTELDLQFHMSTHQKQFICKMCDAAFHVEFLLDRHMETHHSSMVNGTSSISDHLNDRSSSTGPGSRSSSLTTTSKSGKKGAGHSFASGGSKAMKELKCDICDKIIGSDAELSAHRKQVHHILQSHGNASSETAPERKLAHGGSNSSSHKVNHGHHHHHSGSGSASTTTTTSTNATNSTSSSGAASSTLSLSCAYCNENCKSRTDLENHMKTHQVVASGKHKCNICDEVCPSATMLAEHKLTHCKVISGTTCTGCKQNISTEEQYYLHMKQHSGTGSSTQTSSSESTVGSTTGASPANSKSLAAQLPIPCIICRQTLMTEIEVQMHSKFHTTRGEGNPVALPSSASNSEATTAKLNPSKSPSSSSTGQRATHQAQCCLCFKTEERPDPSGGRNGFCTEPQPFICDDCYQKKAALATLPFPPRFYMPPGNLQDLSAKSPSSTTPEVDGRPASSNSGGTATTSPDNSMKTYQCIKCQMSFGSEQEIQAHVVVHLKNEGSSHDCYVCNQVSFDSPLKLQCHLIEHTFEGCSSFTCYMCSSVFTTAAGLQQHMLEHGLHTRPYDCSLCHLKFFFRTELDNHMVTHEQLKELLSKSNNGKEDAVNLMKCASTGNSSNKRPLNLSSGDRLSSTSSSPISNGNNRTSSSSNSKQKRKKFFYRSDDSDEEMEPVVNVKVEISPVTKSTSDTGPCGHKLTESPTPPSQIIDDDRKPLMGSSSEEPVRSGSASNVQQKIDNQSDGAR